MSGNTLVATVHAFQTVLAKPDNHDHLSPKLKQQIALIYMEYAAALHKEVDQFIQIVNGDESLKKYAATILEKAKGDINKALDLYYNDNTGISNETKHKLFNSHKTMDAESSSSICSVDRNYELSESNGYDIKPNIGCTALTKEEVSINYISLPPDIYSPIDHG
ncbi:DNA ligase 6 [Dorcoceras hygrometricum]|uniref:DNA ligase 6 n=1 Tax=Dorcoceras hygrometricum TaxID=472368 RepID=A0A2Z7BFD1_9LAMI|nr:DNA ligase 6 [Dorcoceras hygrometricum]